MTDTYRTGAIGALMDIYERRIVDLKAIVQTIPAEQLLVIIDPDTQDDNCRSFQGILSHVVYAGFGYAASIHCRRYPDFLRSPRSFFEDVPSYLDALDAMFAFTVTVFGELTDNDLEQTNEALKMTTGWGQRYDIEQLMEHAILHILRHGRQIKRLLEAT